VGLVEEDWVGDGVGVEDALVGVGVGMVAKVGVGVGIEAAWIEIVATLVGVATTSSLFAFVVITVSRGSKDMVMGEVVAVVPAVVVTVKSGVSVCELKPAVVKLRQPTSIVTNEVVVVVVLTGQLQSEEFWVISRVGCPADNKGGVPLTGYCKRTLIPEITVPLELKDTVKVADPLA